jgi:6-phosphogluconolactonase
MGEVHPFPDLEALSAALAARVAMALVRAVQDYGEASIALAGGRTPRRVYELLAEHYRDSVPWQSVHCCWSDERCVPPDHPDSNYRLAHETLLSRVPVWQEKIHRMRGEADPQAEAARYSARLEELFADQLGDGPIAFDVMLLGMGDDGHTASLFPDTGAVGRTEPCLAIDAPQGKPPGWRLSLSLPVINAARLVCIGVAGEGKAAVLRAVLAGGAGADQYPAAHVQPADAGLHWYADAAALGR